jgi:hypothetical protein
LEQYIEKRNTGINVVFDKDAFWDSYVNHSLRRHRNAREIFAFQSKFLAKKVLCEKSFSKYLELTWIFKKKG